MAAERTQNVSAKPEMKLNLSAIKKCDQYVVDILDNASQVALYKFNGETQAWEKTEVEGALFVYSRATSPKSAFFIMNRLNMKNMTQPITKNMEFKLQDPFLLYRNRTKDIYGIWFYDRQECKQLADLMKSLSFETIVPDSAPLYGSLSNPGQLKEARHDNAAPAEEKVDIMQLFAKAQERYNNLAKVVSSEKSGSQGTNTPQNIKQQQQQTVQQQQEQQNLQQQRMFLQQNQHQAEQLQKLLQNSEPQSRKQRAYSSPAHYLSGQGVPSPVGRGVPAPKGRPLENGLSPGKDRRQSQGKEIVKSPPMSIVKLPTSAPASKTQDDSAVEIGKPGVQRKLFQNEQAEASSTMLQALAAQMPQIPVKESPQKSVDQLGASGSSLMSPLAFQPSTKATTSSVQAPPKQAQKIEIAALTQEQLAQALTYLLKNDPEFVSKIHEAYIKSLQEMLPS